MLISSTKATAGSEILLKILENLDITTTQYQEAIRAYQAVGAWLCAEGSAVARYSPDVAPQGSFRIGTVIKPWTDTDLYDLDFTVKFWTDALSHTQQQVKQLLGDRLKAHKTYERMLDDEHRRCWRLLYGEDSKFYMDLVAAIPDNQLQLMSLGVAAEYRQDPLAITDNLSPDYEKLHADWPKSNMNGFATWFINRMEYQLTNAMRQFAVEQKMSVEEVQVFQVKTPLQRIVQLLKRHRDVQFKDDEDAPISVIITTLAALSYDQYSSGSLYELLSNTVMGMRSHIEVRYGDEHWVANPVNPRENFADKWSETPRKKELFYEWLDKVEADIRNLFAQNGRHNYSPKLKDMFGEGVVNRALNHQAGEVRRLREAGLLLVKPASGTLNRTVGRKVPDHQHYGSE